MTTDEINEAMVRVLRDSVYDRPITGGEWEKCKAFWLETVNRNWLMARRKMWPISPATPD